MRREVQLKIDQISVLIAKDFKLKYDSTVLGFFWSLIIPLLMSCVFYLVFGVMMRVGRCENYMLYLVSGNFLWHFFAGVVGQNGTVLIRNTQILKKTAFDHRLLIWGTLFTEGAHFLLTIPILAGVMVCFGIVPTWATLVNLVLALALVTLLSVGVGYFYAAINIMFRDLERIMSIVLLVWMYMSPVFMTVNIIPESIKPYYMLNPMTGILCLWRNALYRPQWQPELLITLVPICLLVFVAGRLVFRVNDAKFTEKI